MEALTLAGLRSLAKLHRAGIDDATERLRAIVFDAHQSLPALLGFPAKNLDRLLAAEDPVPLLVNTIEWAPRVARAGRARAEGDQARQVAEQLVERLELDESGCCALPLGDIALIARLNDREYVAFGDLGAVQTRVLHALLRACRHVNTCAVVLRQSSLDVSYETACSRGVIRLHLCQGVAADDALLVPLPGRTAMELEALTPVPTVVEQSAAAMVPAVVEETADTPVPTVIEESAEAERAEAPRQHVLVTNRMRRFGKHLAAALVAAALGGSQ